MQTSVIPIIGNRVPRLGRWVGWHLGFDFQDKTCHGSTHREPEAQKHDSRDESEEKDNQKCIVSSILIRWSCRDRSQSCCRHTQEEESEIENQRGGRSLGKQLELMFEDHVSSQLTGLSQLDDLPILALHAGTPERRRVVARTCPGPPPRSTITCQWPGTGTTSLAGLFVRYPP